MQNIIPQDEPQHNLPYTPHTKRCPQCKNWLSLDNFHPQKGRKDGLQSWCKKCTDNESKNKRKYRLRWKYKGFTQGKYDKMFSEQGGVCKVCGNPEISPNTRRKGEIAPLAIDHDHKTDDVRALLCHACNASLGLMQEDPKRIQALKEYAEWCQTREPNVKIVQGSLFK